ncbi:MAG: xanthine dehydrogenase family protein molybdopterin-binding subunit [Bryobacteraceae bacterium]
MSATSTTLSRRTLLKATLESGAAALIIGFEVPRPARGAPDEAATNPLQAWVKIDRTGVVTLIYSKSEMGQGVSTSLPMILAEELGVDWKNVKVGHAPVEPAYSNQGTFGSHSVTSMWMPLRTAGATARELLIAAAAQRWGVAPVSCTAKAGAVWHGDSKLSYGELVESASRLPAPDLSTVPLKNPANFELIGKSVPRLDIPAKTDGSAIFGLDVRVPGMTYAMVERCPVFGGKVKSFDASKAKAIRGVHDVFEIEPEIQGMRAWGGVAVLAESTYLALEARKQLKIDWNYGPAVHESSETLRRQFRALVDSRMKVVLDLGDAEAAIANAPPRKKIECDYELPFEAHATMEPMNCTVHIQSDRAEASAPTQNPNAVHSVIAKLTGLPPEKIQVHTMYLGGGFGRRGADDYAIEAAQIAKRTGKPVQLVWSREDDTTHDFYRPASYHRISGALDADGNILAWRHKCASTSLVGWRNPNAPPESSELGCTLQMPYLTKNYRLEYSPASSAVPRGYWRSVEASFIGFVMESFVDEMAHAAQADPYEFRVQKLGERRLVKNALSDRGRPLDTGRLKAVLQLAAEKGDWGKPMPPGEGRGIACHYSMNSYVANVVEVAVRHGSVRVNRIVSAADVGTPVHPDGIRAQVEGAIVYGLTAALKSQITIEGGHTVQTNFNNFAALAMNETPRIEVHIVPSTVAPTGIGEPGLPPAAPALMNAIFAATGKRIRRLPLTSGDLV